MKTSLLPDDQIRANIRSTMPAAGSLAFVMGSAIVGSILWAVKTLNGAPLGGPVAVCIFGVLWILAMWLSYRFISTLEYKAALKYEAELAGDQFIVTGRSGKPKTFVASEIKSIHFSGEYSIFIKAIASRKLEGKAMGKLAESELRITDAKGKKHKFEGFFLSVDPESFAAVVNLVMEANPEISIT